MPRLDVKRYSNPDETGYTGYIEPEGLEWIVFARNDGALVAYNRDPDTGAVIGEPAILV